MANRQATLNWTQVSPGGSRINQYAIQVYNEATGPGGKRKGDCTFGRVIVSVQLSYYSAGNNLDPTGQGLGFGRVKKPVYGQDKATGKIDPEAEVEWQDDRAPTVRVGGGWEEFEPTAEDSVPAGLGRQLGQKASSTLSLHFTWNWYCCDGREAAAVITSGYPASRGTVGPRRTEPYTGGG